MIEGDEKIPHRMNLEIYEETGITHIRALCSCSVNIVQDIWLHSVLCLADGYVWLNPENVEYRWIRPADITQYDTVPALGHILFLLLGCVGALSGEHYVYAGTATHGAGYIVSGVLAGSCMYQSGFFGVY